MTLDSVFFSAFDPQHLFPRFLCKGCFIKLLATSIIYHDLMLIRAKTTSCVSKDMELTQLAKHPRLGWSKWPLKRFFSKSQSQTLFLLVCFTPQIWSRLPLSHPRNPTVPLVSFVHSGGSRKRSSSPVQRPDLRTAPWAAFDSKQHEKTKDLWKNTNPEPGTGPSRASNQFLYHYIFIF